MRYTTGMHMTLTRALYIICALLGIFLLGFQLYWLDGYSIWHDEAFSGLLVRYDIGEMIDRITLDVHPPLYYLLLRVWTDLIGNTTFTLRLFSLFFGCVATYLTWYAALMLTRERNVAYASAFLFFANSFVIQHNMEARMYTLGITLILGTLIASLTALGRTGSDRWRAWGAFTLLAAAALYTHYYTVFYIIAIGIALLLLMLRIRAEGGESGAHVASLLVSTAAVGILYIPWLPTFIAQARQVAADYWIGPMTTWSIPSTIWKLLTGVNAHPGESAHVLGTEVAWTALLSLLLVLLAAAGVSAWKSGGVRMHATVFSLLIVPFVASALVSAKTSIYLDRYFIYSMPFFAILIASAAYRIPKGWLRLGTMTLLLVGTALSFPVRFYGLNIPARPGMRAAEAYVATRATPGDGMVIGSSFVFFTHRYYNASPITPQLLGNNLVHYSGTALLNESDIIRDLSLVNAPSRKVWTIDTTGFGNYQLVPPANWQKISEASFDDIYDHRGTIIVREYTLGE